MTSVEEWRKWVLQQLIGSGLFNAMLEQHLRERAGKYFDTNLDSALHSLMDDGIITYLESSGEARYIVNFDKLKDAQIIMNSDPVVVNQTSAVQPFTPDPSGYTYWFEKTDNRIFRKQSIYRIYKGHNDSKEYAAQVITKSMGKVRTWYLGSLNNSRSYISALWRAIPIIAKERKHGLFILQDLQNKEPKACGNNRQRGKIALAIFCELGYVHEVETKGVSTKYALGRNKPFDRTLDDIFSELTHDRSAQEINDPEQFYDVETEELEQRPKNWNKDSEFVT